ncbi:hypothetical protein CCP4SC76_6640005 [Gammaproteobacteria bacterium]
MLIISAIHPQQPRHTAILHWGSRTIEDWATLGDLRDSDVVTAASWQRRGAKSGIG